MGEPEPSIRKKLLELTRRRHSLHEQIAKAVRPIIPVLKDHKLDNVAKQFDEKFFELDALEQEMVDFFRRDPETILRFMLGDPK